MERPSVSESDPVSSLPYLGPKMYPKPKLPPTSPPYANADMHKRRVILQQREAGASAAGHGTAIAIGILGCRLRGTGEQSW